MPEHQTITPSVLYFGTPIVLIVTCNPDGTANITPMSSVWALGQRVVLGLGLSGQGTINLLREREGTLNVPSARLWRHVERIARTTGADPVPSDKAERGYLYEADKFRLGGFTRKESDLVRPPRIPECPLQLEGRLLAYHRSTEAQGNASAHIIVEMEVRRVHAHRDIVVPGTDHIDTARWNPLFYVYRHYFGEAVDLGKNFRAEE